MAKSFYLEEHHFKRDVVHGWALADIYLLILCTNSNAQFQIKIPRRRKSTILQSIEKYQKEAAEKENTPQTPPSPFSNKELNTPLLQRIAKKLFNDNNQATPIQNVTLDTSDRNISLSDIDKTKALKTSTPKLPTKKNAKKSTKKNTKAPTKKNSKPSTEKKDTSRNKSNNASADSCSSLQLQLSESDGEEL